MLFPDDAGKNSASLINLLDGDRISSSAAISCPKRHLETWARPSKFLGPYMRLELRARC